jgi:hypothetical protein
MKSRRKILSACRCLLLVLLVSASFAEAQQPKEEPAIAVITAPTAPTVSEPAVQGSPVQIAEQDKGLLQKAALPSSDSAGICPVIDDLLKDYCTQYPADPACSSL